MDRAEFLQARITHNEIQWEEVLQCQFSLGFANVDVGVHHMHKALHAVDRALAEISCAIEADRGELVDLEIVTEEQDGT